MRSRNVPLVIALLLAPLAAGCVTGPDDPLYVPPLGDNPHDERPIPKTGWSAFDAEAAWDHVLWQVTHSNGTPRYRTPGTADNTAVAQGLVQNLTGLGWEAGLQHFTDTYRCAEVPMHNVVARLQGRNNTTVILGAHYDSRPLADQDPDASKRDQPVLGANDGASGVAVLVDVARVLAERDNNHTYVIVFFDGEDGGHSGPTAPSAACSPWIQGSTYFANNLTADEVARAKVMYLLDMVGDENLNLKRERQSAAHPHRTWQDLVWATAAKLNHTQFKDELGPTITDDHVPFQRRGIPAVDLIHLDSEGASVFPDSWHTTFDTLDHMSRESLRAVGETLLATLAQIETMP